MRLHATEGDLAVKTRTTRTRVAAALVAFAVLASPVPAMADPPPARPSDAAAQAPPAATPNTPQPPPTASSLPSSAAPAPEPPPPWLTRGRAAAIAGGLAVAGAAVGTVFGIAALDDKSAFDRHPTETTGNAGNRYAVYCDVGLGVAVVAGVTGLVLFLTRDETSASAIDARKAPTAEAPAAAAHPLAVAASPIVFSHGGGAGALLRF
jgi:hypothetical protein